MTWTEEHTSVMASRDTVNYELAMRANGVDEVNSQTVHGGTITHHMSVVHESNGIPLITRH